MEFKQFASLILDEIKDPSATVSYGEIGVGYQKVLAIKDGKIIELGEFLYDVFWKRLYRNTDKLVQFGRECEDFRLGFRKTPPCWCYKSEKGLTFED